MGIVARHRTLDVAYAKAALRAVNDLFERRRDAFHVARIAELEGCIAQGRTEAEARSELRDAQRLFIETMLDNGVPVPEPRSSRATARSVTPPVTRSSPSPA